KSFDATVDAQYRVLLRGMIESYEKRNIGIVEFADFFDSYRSSVLQLNNLQSNRAVSFEKLNHAAGYLVIHP
ncbi:MAG TPA: channel protein TolC, partial [Bacteroidota bacterium]|nr:channel protein TolC [Bacteroidota bacterium]